jgi:glutamyl-tRNA synthetase
MKFTRGDTTVAFEKLWFLQKKHAQRYATLDPSSPYNPRHDLNKLALPPLLKHLKNREDIPVFNSLPEGTPKEDFVRSLLFADAQNYTTPSEFISRNISFFIPPTKDALRTTIPSLKLHNIPKDVNPSASHDFVREFDLWTNIKNWNKDAIKVWTNAIIEDRVSRSVRNSEVDEEPLENVLRRAWGKLVHGYIRWAIVAGRPGPDGAVSMSILGREETVRRFELARDVVMETSERDTGREKAE